MPTTPEIEQQGSNNPDVYGWDEPGEIGLISMTSIASRFQELGADLQKTAYYTDFDQKYRAWQYTTRQVRTLLLQRSKEFTNLQFQEIQKLIVVELLEHVLGFEGVDQYEDEYTPVDRLSARISKTLAITDLDKVDPSSNNQTDTSNAIVALRGPLPRIIDATIDLTTIEPFTLRVRDILGRSNEGLNIIMPTLMTSGIIHGLFMSMSISDIYTREFSDNKPETKLKAMRDVFSLVSPRLDGNDAKSVFLGEVKKHAIIPDMGTMISDDAVVSGVSVKGAFEDFARLLPEEFRTSILMNSFAFAADIEYAPILDVQTHNVIWVNAQYVAEAVLEARIKYEADESKPENEYTNNEMEWIRFLITKGLIADTRVSYR